MIGFLRELRGNKEAADQPFVILEDVETVAGGRPFSQGDIAAQRARVDEFANQLDRGAIVPVQFVAPVAGFFLEQWSSEREWICRRSTICVKSRRNRSDVIIAVRSGRTQLAASVAG